MKLAFRRSKIINCPIRRVRQGLYRPARRLGRKMGMKSVGVTDIVTDTDTEFVVSDEVTNKESFRYMPVDKTNVGVL